MILLIRQSKTLGIRFPNRVHHFIISQGGVVVTVKPIIPPLTRRFQSGTSWVHSPEITKRATHTREPGDVTGAAPRKRPPRGARNPHTVNIKSPFQKSCPLKYRGEVITVLSCFNVFLRQTKIRFIATWSFWYGGSQKYLYYVPRLHSRPFF